MGMTTSGARYEILIDGKTRSYRDTKPVALEAAQLRNLTSVVTVRDVGSGEVFPINVTTTYDSAALPICDGTRWVCEAHPDRPWGADSKRACDCGGDSMPCEACNHSDGLDHPPDLPPGFTVSADKDGGRH
jgi:hypothetical protein